MTSDVWSIERLCDYISENAERIAVRVQLNGKWQSLFLTELPTNLAIEESLRFIKEMRIPVVMKKETS